MAEAATELARGHKLKLTDGTQVRIIFTLYTLAVIEDELGSLDAINTVFKTGSQGRLIRMVGKMLANALIDENGDPYSIDEDELLRRIALDQVASVIQGVKEGLTEAFQEPQAETKQTVTLPVLSQTAHSDSLGAHFSTSGAPSSNNDAAIFGD